jgi:hypothetical protein
MVLLADSRLKLDTKAVAMPSFQGLFRVIRENPKKIIFFSGISYFVADFAINRWRYEVC